MIENSGATYFAALNTGQGFISYFDNVFGGIDTVYVIKGGAGTGKSRLMRQISAKAKGKGVMVEEFLCSSDPASLDGIIIPRLGVAMLDGTAPHVYEPKLIGARERLVDLGAFLDCEVLREKREEIEALVAAKKRRYKQVYEYLKVISIYDGAIDRAAEKALDADKMQRAVQKSALWLKKSESYEKKVRIRSAVSTQGHVVLNTYALKAKKRFAIAELCRYGRRYLSKLLELSEREGISVEVSYDPFCPECPDALYYPESGVAFYIGSDPRFDETLINMRRFANDTLLRPYKPEIRAIGRLKGATEGGMTYDHTSIVKLHFALEEIYSKAMDFGLKERLTDKLIKEIFK